jgi:hypothetical protein
MISITLTTKVYNKKANTKTAYSLESTEVEVISQKTHSLITNNDTCKWFRRLGGLESVVRGYTCDGYKVTKLTSTSPDRQIKKVREFSFKWIEAAKVASV